MSFAGTPAWNSRANGSHEARSIDSFDLSNHLSALQPGQNILSLHGLNVSASSSDFIISAALTAGQGNADGEARISPAAIEYTGPILLTKSLPVKSRVLDDVTWSALNETIFAVGPVAETLRITEIMYHPQGNGDPNEEYIKLKNIGTEPLSLNRVTLTHGIDFSFPDSELASGQTMVIVKDLEAFEARYGTDINVAGQYSGKLSNSGERIRLEDAVGQTVLDFEYSDSWYGATDGRGYALTIIDAAHTDPDNWNEKHAWRVSVDQGGSPR